MVQQIPPGPPVKGLFGNVRAFQQQQIEFLTANRDQYGDLAYIARIGNRRVYQLNHPDDIQMVLVKHPDQVEKTPALKRATRKAIGSGLLTSEGEFHKRQRKLVQPAFHARRIASYADVMVDYAGQLADTWQQGEQRNLAHDMMELTMRIVGKTLFDREVSSEADVIGSAITVGLEATMHRLTHPLVLPEWVPTPTNRLRQQSARLLDETINEIIQSRRQTGEDNGDLLSMLLMAADEDDGGQMNNKQVRDEAMTLFIAGHETTANALSWAFYLLAQHSDVDAKLREEIERVLEGRAPTFADLPNLIYAEQVVREAMRLYPPAWIITRLTTVEMEIRGYRIPKGSMLVLSPYVMHHHPRYWDEPEAFKPERFAAGWEERVPKYAYFPFGGGPRICVGNQFALMEAHLLLVRLMQRAHFDLLPQPTVEMQPLVTLRPRNGIPVRVSLRERVVQPV